MEIQSDDLGIFPTPHFVAVVSRDAINRRDEVFIYPSLADARQALARIVAVAPGFQHRILPVAPLSLSYH